MIPSRSKNSPRRRPLFQIGAEVLEGRQLLTGGAGNTIALSRGTIAAAGSVATATFNIASTHFTLPRGRMTLGVDVVAASGSTIAPRITAIQTGTGKAVVADGIPRGPQATAQLSADAPHAVLATITAPRQKGSFTASYQTKITATGKTSGDYLLGYYLPGDVNGDGNVTQADLKTIKGLFGKNVNSTEYQFDADSNRDGIINQADLKLAKKNLGVITTITPDFTANLDPATDTGAADRITNSSTVKFNGNAAPGATITYTEVNQKTPDVKTVTSSTGQYTVSIPLTPGTSTFKVTSTDSFGQTISGSIQPVTYTTSTVPTATKTA